MKLRAVVEMHGRVVHVGQLDGDETRWFLLCDALRDHLRDGARDGKCAAAVVSIHFCDERCDHE